MESKKSLNLNCYLEEYKNKNGEHCIRIRDKVSNKKVDAVSTDRNTLLQLFVLLNKAKEYSYAMPTIFLRSGEDIVFIKGIKIFESSEEIRIDITDGEYYFK